MNRLSLIAAILFMVSMDASSNILERQLTIINDGQVLTRFSVPKTTKIDISSEQVIANEAKTKFKHKGAAQVILTFPSGSVIIKSEEIDIE